MYIHNTPRDVWALMLEGGLGDLVACHYRHPVFTRLAAWRAKNPLAHLRLVVCSHNPASPDLFRYSPYLDEIVWVPWMAEERDRRELEGRYGRPLSGNFDHQQYISVPGHVCLGPGDRAVVQSLVSRGPYIAMQSYAGTPERNLNHVLPLEAVAAEILAAGYNLVLVGGQTPLTHSTGAWPRWELFTGPNDARCVCLSGLNNPRICVGATQQAIKYIGCDSAYMTAASMARVPSLIFSFVDPANHPIWAEGCPKLAVDAGAQVYSFDHVRQHGWEPLVRGFLQS